MLLNVLHENISVILRLKSPLPVKATHFLSMFGIPEAFHCVTPAVTRGFGYSGLIHRTTSRGILQVRIQDSMLEGRPVL